MDSVALMKAAIAEARKAMGRTHPNPAVGAVVFHRGGIATRGFTQPAGQHHAEVMALNRFRDAGHRPDESTTLAVTLEPCSTTGRTPPCTEAILQSGIRNVLIGAIDPNPAHRGRGIDQLLAAGLSVEAGVLEDDCEDLNLIFNWRMEKGIPLFAAKIATTIDGRIATRGGLSKWITGPKARQDVHHWRRYFPAIGVGAGTVLSDNPVLTARLGDEPPWCPVRFVFDRNLVTFNDELPSVYTDSWKNRTIVVTSRHYPDRVARLRDRHGLAFWELDTDSGDGGLAGFSRRCAAEAVDGVYIEGGAHLLSSFLEYRFLHYLFAYRAPRLLADTSGLAPFSGYEPETMQETVTLARVRQAEFGDDQLMRGFIVYPE